MFRQHVRFAVAVLLAGLAIGAVILGSFGRSDADMFMPHAHCYLFNRKLILLHGWSDFVIGLSYVSISATLTYLVLRSRRDLPFHWVMMAFALFIVACGGTHFMELWTLDSPHPRYWLSGWLKLLTATASLLTALLLPPLVPKIRAVLQSSRLAAERKTELEKAYRELQELYQQAVETATLPKTGEMGRTIETDAATNEGSLARMAKEVTIHARELERAKAAAETANRAKDQFLAVLSHELRTPLTPALAAASDLENSATIDPVELRSSIALIRRNIELEARLVDDLLDLTRISKGKLEIHFSTIDLHQTIRHAAEMSRSDRYPKRSEVALHLDATEGYVKGDGARLAQVFWNLILNAVKYTPSDAIITIRTSNPKPGVVRAEVVDQGIGIAPEMLSRIFEPFQQAENSTERRFGGIGLGLSIAKGLVEAHGGCIIARSEGKGHGATFVIELATIVPPAEVKTSDVAPSTKSAKRSLRILLVEDHEDTRETFIRLLTRWGHVVKAVATVAQALEARADFLPELLLSDVGLPDGTGMDLLRKLRQDDSELPAIAMSGYGMEADLQQTSHAGFHAHLVKPVAAERLKEAIDWVCAE